MSSVLSLRTLLIEKRKILSALRTHGGGAKRALFLSVGSADRTAFRGGFSSSKPVRCKHGVSRAGAAAEPLERTAASAARLGRPPAGLASEQHPRRSARHSAADALRRLTQAALVEGVVEQSSSHGSALRSRRGQRQVDESRSSVMAVFLRLRRAGRSGWVHCRRSPAVRSIGERSEVFGSSLKTRLRLYGNRRFVSGRGRVQSFFFRDCGTGTFFGRGRLKRTAGKPFFKVCQPFYQRFDR